MGVMLMRFFIFEVINMNKLDSLILKAKLKSGKMYMLMGIVEQEIGLYNLELNLHKYGEIIKNYQKSFNTEKSLTDFVDGVSKQYELKEDEVLIFFMNYGEESG